MTKEKQTVRLPQNKDAWGDELEMTLPMPRLNRAFFDDQIELAS